MQNLIYSIICICGMTIEPFNRFVLFKQLLLSLLLWRVGFHSILLYPIQFNLLTARRPYGIHTHSVIIANLNIICQSWYREHRASHNTQGTLFGWLSIHLRSVLEITWDRVFLVPHTSRVWCEKRRQCGCAADAHVCVSCAYCELGITLAMRLRMKTKITKIENKLLIKHIESINTNL